MRDRNAKRRARRKFWDICYEILFKQDELSFKWSNCPSYRTHRTLDNICKYCKKSFNSEKDCPCRYWENKLGNMDKVLRKMRQLYKKNRPKGF